MPETSPLYPPRRPRGSQYYQCVEDHFDRLEQVYEERFEKRYYIVYRGSGNNKEGSQASRFVGLEGQTSSQSQNALTLFAQDAETKLMLCTAVDIKRSEADDQVLAFLSFWKKVHRGVKPTLVFDSKFTDYAHLSELNRQKIQFSVKDGPANLIFE